MGYYCTGFKPGTMDHRMDRHLQTDIQNSKGFHIEPIEEEDIDYIIDMCVRLFTEATDYEYSGLFFYVLTDFSISRKAVLNGKIIGIYLLNNDSLTSCMMKPKESLAPYATKKGLQGVALGILKEYRGQGYGRRLRDSILSTTEYDYIWGLQGKTLNNLENWLAYGRRLVGETESNYVTLMDLGQETRILAQAG